MARSPRERYGTVDLASADVVLAGTQELLPVLRAAAVRAGIDAARMRVIGVDDLPDPDETWDAALAVIAIRRPGDDPAFHRAQAAAELIAPMLAPHAVRIVVTVSGDPARAEARAHPDVRGPAPDRCRVGVVRLPSALPAPAHAARARRAPCRRRPGVPRLDRRLRLRLRRVRSRARRSPAPTGVEERRAR